MNSFEASVKAALDGRPRGTLFLAAVSGGADSTAMLAALVALRRKTGFRLRVLHVEHGIRPPEESREDAKAVVELCRNLKVSCRVVSFPPGCISRAGIEWGLGTEAAARFFRHRAWNREARRIGAARILVAHTRDDLLETCLIGILRGSGPAGLALMPRERGRILRPLLDLSRADVLAFLEGRGIPFRTDSTNGDTRFLRNRIRHKLVPYLDGLFPSWRNSLIGLAETQALTAAFISAEVQKRLPWKPGEDGLWIDADAFMTEPPIIQEEGIFLAADMLASEGARGTCGRVPRRKSLRKLLKELRRAPKSTQIRGCAAAGDLGQIRLETRDNKVKVRKAQPCNVEWGFSLLIDGPGLYTLKGNRGSGGYGHLKIKAESLEQGVMDSAMDFTEYEETCGSLKKNSFFASLPVVFRPWRGKDFIVKAGHKRYLSDILKGESQAVYSGFITAEDRNGNVAFVGLGDQAAPLLLARDTICGTGECRFLLEIE